MSLKSYNLLKKKTKTKRGYQNGEIIHNYGE